MVRRLVRVDPLEYVEEISPVQVELLHRKRLVGRSARVEEEDPELWRRLLRVGVSRVDERGPESGSQRVQHFTVALTAVFVCDCPAARNVAVAEP